MTDTSQHEELDETLVERSRRLDREIAEADAKAAKRSVLEGSVMRSPGGMALVTRISKRRMPQIKK